MTLVGTIRQERAREVFIRATIIDGREVDAIEGHFCSADELSFKSAEDEDAFVQALVKKLARRRFWKSIWRKFLPTKKSTSRK